MMEAPEAKTAMRETAPGMLGGGEAQTEEEVTPAIPMSINALDGEGRRTDALSELDVVVVGAGMAGLCFARDIASTGKRVLVVDRAGEIGGARTARAFPRIDALGAIYRCLSLAPAWTREHAASEWYRPTWDEVRTYAKALVDHPNITVETSCEFYDVRQETKLPVATTSRGDFVAKVVYLGDTATGSSLTRLRGENTASSSSPRIVRASDLDAKAFAELGAASGRIVVVGSGRAALDILLQLEEQKARVLWAHRGHATFFDRDKDPSKILDLLNALLVEAEKTGQNFSEIGIDRGLFLAAGGPLTKQQPSSSETAWAAADALELQRARGFEQLYVDALEDDTSGSVLLEGRRLVNDRVEPGSTESSIVLGGENDWLVLCTGGICWNKKKPTHLFFGSERRRTACPTTTSSDVPLSAIVPLCLALEWLNCGTTTTTTNSVASKLDSEDRGVVEHSSEKSRKLDDTTDLSGLSSSLPALVLPGDIAYSNEWIADWYGRNLDVREFLCHFRAPSSVFSASSSSDETRWRKPGWWRPAYESPGLLAHADRVVGELGDENFMTWLNISGNVETELSFEDAWRASRAIAGYLTTEWGAGVGNRILLCYAPGPSFYLSFLACLRCGAVAVPAYPPDPSKLQLGVEKLRRIQENCDAKLALCDTQVKKLRQASFFVEWPRIEWLNTEEHLPFDPPRASDDVGRRANDDDDDGGIAFFQYTSGTTGNPKGVMVTLENIWHNVNEIYVPTQKRTAELRLGVDVARELFEIRRRTPRVTGISWLPQYHDSGLVLMFVGSLVAGYHLVSFSPLSFLGNPLLPVSSLSKYRAHVSANPDFAYNLILKRAGGNIDRFIREERVDLSTIFCLGAGVGQRTRPPQLRAFSLALAPAGLSSTVWQPAYGLAEHVVATAFEIDGIVVSAAKNSRVVVASCGSQSLCALKVVDSQNCLELRDGNVGEIWLSSPSVALGYFGMPELSKTTFRAKLVPNDGREYPRTGDEGFLEKGRLFVCGRIKDLIIVAGRNYYPEDCELSAERACPDEVRPGCAAAFSTSNRDTAEEMLVVVFEIRANFVEDAARVAGLIARKVTSDTGLAAGRVVAVAERTVPKTTSGKVRRRETRDELLAGKLRVLFDWTPSCVPSRLELQKTNKPSTTSAAVSSFFLDWGSRLASFVLSSSGGQPEIAQEETSSESCLREMIKRLCSEDKLSSRVSAAAAVGLASSKSKSSQCDDFNTRSSHDGVALIERVAKQIVGLFPADTELKTHPDMPEMFGQLGVPATSLEHHLLRHDASITFVSDFVDAIKRSVVAMPILVRAAQELEVHFPGLELPVADDRAANDLRAAVIYCYALHTIGVSMLRTSEEDGGALDFAVCYLDELLGTSKIDTRRYLERWSSDRAISTAKLESILAGAQLFCDIRRDTSSKLLSTKNKLGWLCENILVDVVEDVKRNQNLGNARAGVELAFWSCFPQLERSKNLEEEGASAMYGGVSGLVKCPVAPSMKAEWVQLCILWNLTFGLAADSLLSRAALLLAPCLLALSTDDPDFFV
ncbi:hypothetical protein CTAYLR_003783 [Chrysophaeum taylorii]|uniref:Uncharacterized protein n=1 Tax=Chrysophaeum taylorii TaxID=2483200 RepID=A0AAD7XNV6_9STRA|nr:hypothetical protein CTAYLR_003783 [Chrysophaeum taylorii]